MSRLDLAQVTLIAATSINVEATLLAIEACQQQVRFADCKLLTHRRPARRLPDLQVVITPEIETSEEYSRFILTELVDHVATSHCLVVQWDGHVVEPTRWDPQFLEFDYVGASWPQFTDGHDVGNGGFSLRSRRLLEACRSPQFTSSHPEDVAIGRHNRSRLEAQGLRFAPREVADSFSAERASSLESAFGFHGVWHMPRVIGADRFWDIYRGLEDRSSVYHDQTTIMRQLAVQPRGLSRCLRMVWDRVSEMAQLQKGQT
ncbi:MAG: hypothetical protein EAY70_07720 [Sphingomonadales bacterium]|nr:MAG: hypothetical protein EAY70_07720 [Sphingomonadales bacterium]